MNLGAGLAAADSFFQAQEHAQDRDFTLKQRAYQSARMQAGLDTLPDQTTADKARLGLAADTSNAGRRVLPGQTANVMAQQGLAATDIAFQGTQQPKVQAVQAGASQFALDSQPKQQAIAGAGLDAGVAQIPENERVRTDANASAATARHQQALVDLSRYLGANDKAGAIAQVNSVAQSESAAAGTKGKKFVDIVPTGEKSATADNRAYELVAEDGTRVPIPYAAVQQAQAMAKTGKYSMHEGRAGDVHVLNENPGSLETKVPAPSKPAAPGRSNSAVPPTIDPKFQNLFSP